MENLFNQIALQHWKSYNTRTIKLLEGMSEQQFNAVLTLNGNTPSWLLGHLAETHDSLFPLLGLGDLRYPELREMYLHNHQSPFKTPFDKLELTEVWKNIYKQLDATFSIYSPEQWLEKHTSISEEDFDREPHRNKFNVLISRTNHLAYHIGQIALVFRG